MLCRSLHRRIAGVIPVAALALLLVATPGPAQPPGLPEFGPAPVEVWWSLAPLVKPTPPAVPIRNPQFAIRNPIDAFILARLREKGLSPSPPADRRTLIRRVYFDLIGLPPTPQEVEAFLKDESPNAYEKVVDRLLASPRYGERWARHWMDAAHFAETHGHDQDRPRPNAWPYRDYLIRSFNADKPYARFVQEQIAGDALFPGDPEGVVAQGFLASGPWDESSLRDIREDTPDREVARYLDRDDVLTTAMSTFTSMTVGCARCHDHKFDPIPQEDYYALQAVFAGVDKAERSYDPDPRVYRKRRDLEQRLARLRRMAGTEDPSLFGPEARAAAAALEKEVGASASRWVVLDPTTFASAGGATLTKQPDGSLRSEGKRPETDVYTITAHTDLRGVAGVRLEVLTDDSLPHRGPGRQDNGNLHLSEFRVLAGPKDDPDAARPVALKSPVADFDQQGWTILAAIDGNPKTAWGIYPEVGKPHRAVFELVAPVGFEGGTALTFVLEQKHGGGHLIGRPRLSVTTAPPPLSAAADLLPATVARILAVPADERGSGQRAELARYALELRAARELASLPPAKLVYAAASDFKPDGAFRPSVRPRMVRMLRRGDINRPGPMAAPGTLSAVSWLDGRFDLRNPDDEGARRAALAKWVTDPRNPLTWRSIVNRVWHYHFGRGIVDTPNDFGRMGAKPTHPELLDWLAVTFRDGGGSLKQLHRLIVTSTTYRQASQMRNAERGMRNEDIALACASGWSGVLSIPHSALRIPQSIDADNHYLWRMNRSRLDAESVHDAILQASGKIDLTMYGPSVRQFIERPGIHVTPLVDYASFDPDRPENYRRSVYRFVFRTLPDPFFEALDCPDSSQLAPVRGTSVGPLQALATWNNKFVVRQSEHLAARLAKDHPGLDGQVRGAFELVLLREPTAAEAKALAGYAARHGLANACRVLLNSNEFMFVD